MKGRDLRFKIARQLAGFTQQELARTVGCSESLIARIESGRAVATPYPYLTDGIAKALNKRPFELGL